jgi:hypothetical protein
MGPLPPIPPVQPKGGTLPTATFWKGLIGVLAELAGALLAELLFEDRSRRRRR